MGYVYALLAAALFGLNGSLTKVIIDSGITAAQLTVARTVSVAVVAGVTMLVTDRRAFRPQGRREWLGLLALGLTGIAMLQWTYAVAVSLLPVGIALLLEYLAVVVVAMIARVFFKERVRGRLWVAIALVLVGMALTGEVWGSSLNPVGVVFGLLSAAALTAYFVFGERLLTGGSALRVAFWPMIVAALVWIIPSAWWEVNPEILLSNHSLGGTFAALSLPLWFMLLWCGVIGSFLPFVFSFLALSRLRATTLGIVASSEVLFAFIFAFLWLGEGLHPVQTVGAAVVVAAILLAQTARPGAALDADLMVSTLATGPVEISPGRTHR